MNAYKHVKEVKMEQTFKSRTFMIEDRTKYNSLDDILSIFTNEEEIELLAGIVHDKDINEKTNQLVSEHVHVVVRYNNPHTLSGVVKQSGLKPERITIWRGNYKNALNYLIHATSDAQKKYQYDISEVKANFDYPEFVKKSVEEIRTKKKFRSSEFAGLLEKFGEDLITEEEMIEQLPAYIYAKHAREIAVIKQYKLEKKYKVFQENLKNGTAKVKVLWFDGPTGTGKTRLAKEIAENQGKPYFVSGSQRDPLFGYEGQEAIILDDIREESFPFLELLKLLDPYNTTAIGSRYKDKYVCADLIIITCPFTPLGFYHAIKKKQELNNGDFYEQLGRRITVARTFETDEILSYFWNGSRLELNDNYNEKNQYAIKNQQHDSTEALEIYQKFIGGKSNED
jgi:hypothetical protein